MEKSSKNAILAESFKKFCDEHPELRFGQALLAWWKTQDPTVGYVYTAKVGDPLDFTDTFYKDPNGKEEAPIQQEKS